MRVNKKIISITGIMLLLAAILTICSCLNSVPSVSKDEIQLKISLDLKEDIGLLVIDHRIGEDGGSGGISNADKSMIKKNDILYWTFIRQDHEKVSDTVELTVTFTVVSEYCEPNYENIYPEELMIPMDPVLITADFGQTYEIDITGDRINGYKAVLTGSK